MVPNSKPKYRVLLLRDGILYYLRRDGWDADKLQRDLRLARFCFKAVCEVECFGDVQ
jgi:hypothetical protein